MRTAILISLALALAACGGSDSTPGEPAATASPSDPLAEHLEGAKMLVDANGLGWKGPGSSIHIGFGASRKEVDSALAATFGSLGEHSRNEECGAGPMEFTDYGALKIAYQAGRFVGWYLDEAEGVVTSDGVGPGMALAQLQEWRMVRVITDSTLEGEFEYQTHDGGMITGFFEGSQNDGSIVALQAGLNCFFR